MTVEKGILATVGVVFAGFVAYKIIEKKKPSWIATAKKSATDAGKKTAEVFRGASDAFKEGYASA